MFVNATRSDREKMLYQYQIYKQMNTMSCKSLDTPPKNHKNFFFFSIKKNILWCTKTYLCIDLKIKNKILLKGNLFLLITVLCLRNNDVAKRFAQIIFGILPMIICNHWWNFSLYSIDSLSLKDNKSKADVLCCSSNNWTTFQISWYLVNPLFKMFSSMAPEYHSEL